MLEHFSFVEVPESQAPRIVDSVDGTEVNGRPLRLEAARS
jgi:hypothetical protein